MNNALEVASKYGTYLDKMSLLIDDWSVGHCNLPYGVIIVLRQNYSTYLKSRTLISSEVQ